MLCDSHRRNAHQNHESMRLGDSPKLGRKKIEDSFCEPSIFISAI